MSERASAIQSVQIGVETTPGTAVPANKTIRSLSFAIAHEGTNKAFRPEGHRFNSLTVVGKEWTALDVTGELSYSEITYPLAGLSYAAPVQQGADLAYKWSFNPSDTALLTPKTFTVEQGSTTRAHKVPYVLFTELGFEFTRDNVKVTGKALGQSLADGVTMTASPTDTAEVIVAPSTVAITLDTLPANIGTTVLSRVFKAGFTVKDLFGPVWPIDATAPSFAAHVDKHPTADATLTLAADAAGMALLTSLRAGDTRYLRIAATGPLANGATNHHFQIDAAVTVQKIGKFENHDGVFAIQVTFDVVRDSTLGKAFSIDVINALATL